MIFKEGTTYDDVVGAIAKDMDNDIRADKPFGDVQTRMFQCIAMMDKVERVGVSDLMLIVDDIVNGMTFKDKYRELERDFMKNGLVCEGG
jgi:hypothetical protein